MNSTQQIIVNKRAAFADNTPEGISLIFVRGFLASMCLSRYLLKAIAADLANTMHPSTSKNSKIKLVFVVSLPSPVFPNSVILACCFKASIPKKKPINANGNAKMV